MSVATCAPASPPGRSRRRPVGLGGRSPGLCQENTTRITHVQRGQEYAHDASGAMTPLLKMKQP